VVDDRDAARQLIGLVQVLRAQRHDGALGDHGPDDVPDLVVASRVEPGSRLVEEQQVEADGVGLPLVVGEVDRLFQQCREAAVVPGRYHDEGLRPADSAG
jgi:hypothetical protein